MKKDKSVQNRSILDTMFPHFIPTPKMVGKQNKRDSDIIPKGLSDIKDCFPNMKKVGKQQENGETQPSLDEIWEWLGDPDKY